MDKDFYILKKSIDLSRVWTREPWISRRARCPETTEADKSPSFTTGNIMVSYISVQKFLERNLEGKSVWTEKWHEFPKVYGTISEDPHCKAFSNLHSYPF